MKKIVLLGDSLRLIGYGPHIGKLLGEDYSVWQSEDNGRFALYTLQALRLYEEHLDGADVVHWNNGNWDVDDLYGEGVLVSVEDYTKTLVRIANILKSKAKRVIFATTIPVRPEYPYADNARISAYNRAAVEALTPLGVEIDDLYSFVLPHMENYLRKDDNVHLTEEGAAACAEVVAEMLRK